MKRLIKAGMCVAMLTLLFGACRPAQQSQAKVRGVVDSVGFATKAWQMDSIMQRLHRLQGDSLLAGQLWSWKTVISPHDDYTYVGYLYPRALSAVRAKTVIIFGVAHKARTLALENKIVFDDFDYWRSPFGRIAVSPLREEIIAGLDTSLFVVSHAMQAMEHSVEAELPFLHYYQRDLQIVPILVPYMSFERMEQIARPLARRVHELVRQKQWRWGRDVAVVISNDAVHYGDRDWGGKNFARFGADSTGYRKAIAFEHQIIRECLTGALTEAKIKKFTGYTVQANDFRQYKWTWCGRYSVPFGLLFSLYWQEMNGGPSLQGSFLGYATSIDHAPLPVKDLGMGVTAPANLHHWVGYVAEGYK